MEQTSQFRVNPGARQTAERDQPVDQELQANSRGCKASQRAYQQAGDHLRRANRDLGELTAFVAASMTTVTAVEAVINIAVDRIGLSREILHVAFELYIVLMTAILVFGVLRLSILMRRRAQAEKKLDQAKRGIYDFCPVTQWPKAEE